MAPRLTIRLLGPYEVRLDDEPVTRFTSNRVRALLAYLAVEASQPHRRDTLAARLWPDWPDRSARTNLRNALSQLRTTIGDRAADPPCLHTTRETIQFNAACDQWVDANAFTALLRSETGGEARAHRLEQAIALYRCDFLEGFSLRDSAPFEEWCVLHRQRLHRELLSALGALTAHHELCGDYLRACEFARRQLELEPWLEEAHRDLMRLLALDGKRGAALAQYDACRRALHDELSAAPSPHTVRLWDQIRDNMFGPPGEDTRADRGPQTAATLPAARRTLEHDLPTPPASERRIATVLSTEVTGSRELLAAAGTEAWAERMNAILASMASDVRRYGGEVAQVRQHGLLALFGVTSAHEDDAERAVLAALAIQASNDADRMGTDLGAMDNLRIRVGVHTGEVIASAIEGDGDGPERTALGSAVIVADELQAAAESGTILVGASTHSVVRPLFSWAASPPISVAGAAGTVTAHRALAHRAPADKGRDIAGLQSPLVGRHSELATLRQAIANLRAGLGGIVTLVGEAGIGKSRLVAEVRKSETVSAPKGPRWVEGRCLSYGAGFAYLLWQNVLRDLLGIDQTTPVTESGEALRATVRGICVDRFDDVYPYLARLLSLPLEDEYEVICRLEGASLRAEIVQAVQLLIEGAARDMPLVLVCEDLHWADPSSLELLEKVLALTDEVPLLLVLVFRADREHACLDLAEHVAREYAHRHTDVQPRPLSSDESDTLVHNLLDAEAIPTALSTRIFHAAGGNPFFAEELIRSLKEAGAIAHDEAKGDWQLTEPLDAIALPDSLHGVLAARIDRLPANARRVLHRASVLGRIFSREVLAAFAGDPAIDNQLLVLVRRELLRERSRLPEATYIFNHDLTREAAYEGMLSRDRRTTHRKAGEAIERLYPGRIDEHLGALARHWDLADMHERAIPYLLRAGIQAYVSYANDEAARYYERALSLLDEPALAGHPGRDDWRLEALTRLGRVGLLTGQVDRAEEVLREAIALGRRVGIPPRAMARIYSLLGGVLYRTANFRGMISLAEDGLSLLGADTECVEAALMNSFAAVGHEWTGRRDQWINYTMRTAGFIHRLEYCEELGLPLSIVAQTYSMLGQPAQGLECASAFEEQAANHHDLRGVAHAIETKGIILRDTGDLRGAIRAYASAMELQSRVSPVSVNDCLRRMSGSYLHLGQLEGVVRCCRRLLDPAEEAGPAFQFQASVNLGIAHLCQGALPAAERDFERLAHPDLYTGNPLGKDVPHFTLGCVRLAQGRRDAAAQSFIAAAKALSPALSSQHPGLEELAFLLDSLEAASDAGQDFRARCSLLRDMWAECSVMDELPLSAFVGWFLEPASMCPVTRPPILERFQGSLAPEWRWHDPFGDCSLVADHGLTVRAANGRALGGVNWSAPRLLRSVRGKLAAQTATSPVTALTSGANPPAIGGIILWKSERNWLGLLRGVAGTHSVRFQGCVEGKEVIIGRGRLWPLCAERMHLRMERAGSSARALCSADGKTWLSVGDAAFAPADPVEVGLVALGTIDRLVCPGAYLDGSAIRFESFDLWAADAS